MFRNYLVVALRNLWRNKSFSIINIGGLGIGLTASYLLMMFINDEMSFDDHHDKSDKIFRLVDERRSAGGEMRQFGHTMAPVGPTLVQDFPQVEDYVRLFNNGRFTVRSESAWHYEGDHFFADPTFFNIFDYDFISGNPETALTEPNSVVLTERAAEKYFGADDPYGKVLTSGWVGDLQVTGVISDSRPNSHLNFSMLISMGTVLQDERAAAYARRWESVNFITYLLLDSKTSAVDISAGLPNFSARYRGEDAWSERRFKLQPLTDIHFRSADIEADANHNKGSILYVYLLSAVALFILLVAIINYTNLATAQFLDRAKEVGVRKAMGAQRNQLITQFVSESILLTLISSLLAFGLIESLLPSFNAFTDKALGLDNNSIGILFSIAGGIMFIGLIAGAYPALFQSRLPATGILKRGLGADGSPGRLRSTLVVTQFAMCIVLVVSTLTVSNQLGFVRNKWLGFDQEHLITVDINSRNARNAFRKIKSEFAKWSTVQNVSVSSRLPGDWKRLASIDVYPGKGALGEPASMNFIGVDEAFLSTYGIELLEGRDFVPGNAADSIHVLINEQVANLFGWENPVGEEISVPAEGYTARVIGVVKNFHFRSLHEDIGPMVLGNWNNPIQSIDYFTLRVTGEDLPGTLAHIKRVHERIDAATPVEINFLDDRLDRFYKMDAKVGTLIKSGALLAILLAALGLLGLVAFTTQRRTKEIGIRKVVGASVASIIALLSGEFVKLVLLANLIAWPIAWYAMSRWLENFAYRVDLGPGVFLLAGILALAVAIGTVSTQALKAASANPVDSLRYE